MAREREREDGAKVAPETDRERQTVCRARAALSEILKRECGPDNPFIRLLAQQRSSRVRQKSSPSANWSSERQQQSVPAPAEHVLAGARAQTPRIPDENIEEAVVNEVSAGANAAPPSPEMRQSMRVLDLLRAAITIRSSEDPEAQDRTMIRR